VQVEVVLKEEKDLQVQFKDKAKKVTSRLNLVEHTLAKELRAQGAYIASPTVLKHYCISCAIHFKILKIRSADNRRKRGKLR
jgi:small subunit ribosomal protein S26e